MRITAESGVKGYVLDLDTNRLVPRVRWVDCEAGLLEAYFVDDRGNIKRDKDNNLLFYKAKGNFKFIPHDQIPPEVQLPSELKPQQPQGRKVVMGAPKCARCPSPLTLPGDDLCPICRAAEVMNQQARTDGRRRNDLRVERIINPIQPRKCEKCSNEAEWAVSDEVEVTPEVGSGVLAWASRNKVLFERGCTVGRRFYCSHCYQPPRLLDRKGEVMEELHEAGGVRPQ